jgi:tubulysin polyketide synthase-like protein
MDPDPTPRALVELTTAEFLSVLLDHKIDLWLEGERLRFSAPKGGFNADLRAELSRRKLEVMRFLRQAIAEGTEAGLLLAQEKRPLAAAPAA